MGCQLRDNVSLVGACRLGLGDEGGAESDTRNDSYQKIAISLFF